MWSSSSSSSILLLLLLLSSSSWWWSSSSPSSSSLSSSSLSSSSSSSSRTVLPNQWAEARHALFSYLGNAKIKSFKELEKRCLFTALPETGVQEDSWQLSISLELSERVKFAKTRMNCSLLQSITEPHGHKAAHHSLEIVCREYTVKSTCVQFKVSLRHCRGVFQECKQLVSRPPVLTCHFCRVYRCTSTGIQAENWPIFTSIFSGKASINPIWTHI